MDQKSKLKTGLNQGNIIIQKPNNYFTEAEKHQIIQELLNSGCTKVQIWEKYTGNEEEHGQLLRWMRKLGYDCTIKTRRPNFAANQIIMSKKKKPKESLVAGSESFGNIE